MGRVVLIPKHVVVAHCLALALCACGGGGGGGGGADTGPSPSATVLTGNFFPVNAGAKWVYATSDAAAPDVIQVVGKASVNGQVGDDFTTTSGADGSVWHDIFVVDATGVRNFAPAGSDPVTMALSGMQLMRLPLTVGDSFQQADVTVNSGVDFDGDGRPDLIRVQANVTVIGDESISTDAGAFPHAAHLRQLMVDTVTPSGGGTPATVNVQTDAWYVNNIGLVQSNRRVWGVGYDQTTTSKLSAFRVGSLKSDYTAPVVTAVTPGPQVVKGSATSVTATFSKPIDPSSILAQTFTVTDSANVRIPGTVRVDGKLLTFSSGQAWATGAYTAQITTDVRDLLGNALAAPRVWNMAIDATAPSLISMTPAVGSQNVGVTASVVLTFSEAPDPNSVDPSQVKLLVDSQSIVDCTIAISGNSITLTPKNPLQPGKQYTVHAWGVTDTVGNPMSQGFSGQFQTLQGMFAYPTAITGLPQGSGAQAMAIADINGDGLNDVLFSTSGGMNATVDGLFAMFGRPDGSLAQPAKIDTGSNLVCNITSIAVGDLNGDGRPDVVVGANYCGAQVLHQAVDGSLLVGEYLNRAGAGVVKIADFDRNGKNVLVGVGGGSGEVNIWRQDTAGVLQFSEAVASGASLGKDVTMGDVNGDGRPDLVVAGSGNVGQDVAVITRNPDGTYAPPTLLSTDSVWGASAVAIGDLNGDGRADIAATTGGNSPTHFVIYYQGAGGAIGPATHVVTRDIPVALALSDLNGDGLLDIVVSHTGWGTVSVYLQQSTGLLGNEQAFSAPYGNWLPGQMAVGDFNADGRQDIVIDGVLIAQLPPATMTSARTGGKAAAALRSVGSALEKQGLRAKPGAAERR